MKLCAKPVRLLNWLVSQGLEVYVGDVANSRYDIIGMIGYVGIMFDLSTLNGLGMCFTVGFVIHPLIGFTFVNTGGFNLKDST